MAVKGAAVKLSFGASGVGLRRCVASMLCLVMALGCGRSQNAQVVKLVGQGKLPQLRNPSKQVVRDLVAKPAGAKVSGVWLINIDLADPEWAHLTDLGKLTDLTSIHFAMTKNTDGFVAQLPAADKVATLEFYGTDLTADGVAQVAKLTQLQALRLEFKSTNIPQRNLSQLEALKNLRKLYVASDRKVNIGGLQSKLPDCKVTTDRLPAEVWDM